MLAYKTPPSDMARRFLLAGIVAARYAAADDDIPCDVHLATYSDCLGPAFEEVELSTREGSVQCDGAPSFCDCGGDCEDDEGSAWCQCEEAQACCARR